MPVIEPTTTSMEEFQRESRQIAAEGRTNTLQQMKNANDSAIEKAALDRANFMTNLTGSVQFPRAG